MNALARQLGRLGRDSRGVTAVEFAAVAPALLMTVLGLMDLSYNLYASTLLEGAVQEAGRNSTIEGAEGKGLAIDDKVRGVVHHIVPGADVDFTRRAYIDYADVGRPEEFTDNNSDGICDNGEPFEDANKNAVWDQDRASASMGGARDAVLYTVTVSYPRTFPLMKWFGFSNTVTARARTVLRNQPYGAQNKASPIGNCT